jgi:hypothetical protein
MISSIIRLSKQDQQLFFSETRGLKHFYVYSVKSTSTSLRKEPTMFEGERSDIRLIVLSYTTPISVDFSFLADSR